MMYKIFAAAPFNGKYPTSSLMIIVMFALSLTIYEIFTNKEKFQNVDLENEGQDQGGEKQALRHSIGNVRF